MTYDPRPYLIALIYERDAKIERLEMRNAALVEKLESVKKFLQDLTDMDDRRAQELLEAIDQ
jgi:hypothetical protein